MMMRSCIIVILTCINTLLIFADCSAQATLHSVKGVVFDASTGFELTHVSINLKHSSTNLSKSTFSSDNGSFRFTGISGDNYSIEVTAIGYKDTVFNVTFNNQLQLNLGKILLISLVKPLQPVNVYAQKPLIEQTTSKLIYNVDADPENRYLNALEILRKVPLITTDANNNIRLNGNADFKIYVNGKPSLIFSHNPQNILQSLQAGSVKNIEVMTNPSPRYQSEGGGGIINITTFRNIVGGINGGGNVRALELNGVQTSADLTAGGKMFSASVFSSYQDRNPPTSNAEMTRLDKLQEQTLFQRNVDDRNSHSLNNGVEITFQPNDRNILTAALMQNTGYNNNSQTQNSHLRDERTGVLSVYQALNRFHNKISTNDYSADFTHTFKNNEERKLDLSYKMSQSLASNNYMFMREPSRSATSNGKNDYSEDQNEYYLEAHYTQPLKQHQFEMGITNTQRRSGSESNYLLFDQQLNNYFENDFNRFEFTENVTSAYLSVALKFNRWSITTSEKWENATSDFTLISGGKSDNTYSYWIPNIVLSRQVKKNTVVRAGYTQRFTRPDISCLDPFVNNADAFNVSYGNPLLKPTLSHVFTFTINKVAGKLFLGVNASHQFTDNSIEQITRVGSDTISRTTYENVGRYSSSTGSVSINTVLFKKLSLSFNGAANYIQFGDAAGKNEKRSGITYSAAIAATANLKRWALTGSGNYLSPLTTVQGSTTTFFTNSMSITRHFLAKNNLTASLSASEPFIKKRTSISEYNSPQFLITQRSLTANRRLNISVNYRFAKIKTD
jgi:outer membrane receptor protein involved in Fe transport